MSKKKSSSFFEDLNKSLKDFEEFVNCEHIFIFIDENKKKCSKCKTIISTLDIEH